jgi:hypothetical protein
MGLPEQIRTEIEASLVGGPEPPTVAEALAAGRLLARRRRVRTAAASVTVVAALVARLVMAAGTHRAGGRSTRTQDAP